MTAQTGNTVHIHYKGTLSDGTLFDTSEGREPLEFTLGEGMVIAGFEKGVLGMKVGEKKKIHIPFKEAYGERKEDLVSEVPTHLLPKGQTPKVGMQVMVTLPSGHHQPATIAKVSEDGITLDLNHPLAGKDLTFELELVEIVQ